MTVQRKRYSGEFKLETIRLYESSGKSAAEIERDLELPAGVVHKWRYRLKDKGEAAFPGKGHQSELEAENKRLRDVSKAAVIFFSKQAQ